MHDNATLNQHEKRNLFFTSLVTFLGMVLLIAIAWFLKIPNPNMVLITGLIVFTAMFGRVSGVISATLIILYSMFFFSTGHNFFSYSDVNLQKILTIVISVVINTFIVATLRHRWKSAQKELIVLNGKLLERNEKLKSQSQTDPLTGLYNRHALRDNYDSYIGNILTVAYLDVDNFKQINDSFGHDIGDNVLREISTSIKETFTNTHAYRYGGDEFLLIRNDADTDLFEDQLHQMRNHLESLGENNTLTTVYFSVGYVYGVAETTADLRNMFERADELMYEAKRLGKMNSLGESYKQ
jgi:diguanylate cyclase (GGDEF)-like protein